MAGISMGQPQAMSVRRGSPVLFGAAWSDSGRVLQTCAAFLATSPAQGASYQSFVWAKSRNRANTEILYSKSQPCCSLTVPTRPSCNHTHADTVTMSLRITFLFQQLDRGMHIIHREFQSEDSESDKDDTRMASRLYFSRSCVATSLACTVARTSLSFHRTEHFHYEKATRG